MKSTDRPSGTGALSAESPAALTEISILIDKAITKLGGRGIVVHIDSIAMMLNWNSFENLAKFLVLTTAKLRKQGAMGLFVMPDHHEERLLAHIAPICDRVIQLSAAKVAPHMVPMALRATHRFLGHGGTALGHIMTSFRDGRTGLRFREAALHVGGLLSMRIARIWSSQASSLGRGPWSNGKASRWMPQTLAVVIWPSGRPEPRRSAPV
jgi:hypothetical protein